MCKEIIAINLKDDLISYPFNPVIIFTLQNAAVQGGSEGKRCVVISYLNPRHSEIGYLKINCDWSLCLELVTLHAGQPKVCSHHVLLTPLDSQTEKRKGHRAVIGSVR